MDKVIIIVGPTATGKSALAVALAKKYGGEIISADSMQIYKGMDIGTAKVTTSEMQGVPHHLIDIISPEEEFSLNEFLDLTRKTVREIIERGKLPFIVGGTGLYISSFTDNIRLGEMKFDPEYRAFLNSYAERNGGAALKMLLRQIDPDSYEKLKNNDVKRISRALEAYRSDGKTLTELNRESKQPPEYDFLKIGLNCEDRAVLYSRIDSRVDKMIENGFIDEVRRLSSLKLSKTAVKAIGYRQIFSYINSNITLDEAVCDMKQESRRYAKRQITWFKRDENILWHNIDIKNCKEIMNSCEKHMEKFLKVCYNKK